MAAVNVQLREAIPVESARKDDRDDGPAVPAEPDVGIRWGKLANFAFSLSGNIPLINNDLTVSIEDNSEPLRRREWIHTTCFIEQQLDIKTENSGFGPDEEIIDHGVTWALFEGFSMEFNETLPKQRLGGFSSKRYYTYSCTGGFRGAQPDIDA